MKLKVGTWCRSYSKGIWRVSRIDSDVFDYDWEKKDWSHTRKDLIFLRRIVSSALKKSFAVEICHSSLVTALAGDELARFEEWLQLQPKLHDAFDQFGTPDPDSVLNIATSLPASRIKSMATHFPNGKLFDCKSIMSRLRSSPIGDSIGHNPTLSTIQFVSPQTQIEKSKIQYTFSRILAF